MSINEAILTFLYNQGYRLGSKVAQSFIQRVEFQTNKRLYGDDKTEGETSRGKKDHRAVGDHKGDLGQPRVPARIWMFPDLEGPEELKFAGLVGELAGWFVYSWLEWMKDWRKI